jgi:hypothetical protein
MFHKVRDIVRAHGVSGLARRSIAYAYRRVCRSIAYAYRRVLWRTAKPREHETWFEHVKSFEIEPAAAQPYKGDIERAFYQHDGRLMEKWHHYLEIYETFLSPLKSRETIRLLEIGVCHGGSLQLWRKYLGSEARIAGLDIDPKTEFSDGNTRVFVGSQDDPLTLGRA